MYEHLNTRTREIVTAFCDRQPIELGGGRIDAFGDDQAQVLSILATYLAELRELGGRELAERIEGLLDEVTEEGELEGQEEQGGRQALQVETTTCGYRLGLLRAHSFRGLAPAKRSWEYDFGGKSHLLYGPNGCGKSSLLGAIAWCLSGRIFRDDQPVDIPQSVKVYSGGEGRAQPSERPDALALMDETGTNTSAMDAYWVEVQLVGERRAGEQKEVWVRRHSQEGLSVSEDGESWSAIETIREAGVDELDAELYLLMPARVSHIRFGKDTELMRVFSQIIGLDDLEGITSLAGSVCRSLRTEATTIQKNELAPEKESIVGLVQRLGETAGDAVKALPSYARVVGDGRSLADVETFGKALGEAIKVKQEVLATDLGIDIPGEGSPGLSEFKKKLENLPGQVQSAVDELDKPLDEVFLESVGFNARSEETLGVLEQTVEEFERSARQKVKERLEWMREEQRDKKVALMLFAAGYFPEGSNECPVCAQDLDKVPWVKEKLDELRPLAEQTHLRKEIEGLGLELVDDLGAVVAPEERRKGNKRLSDRVLLDWSALKERISKGLLGPIVSRFDEAVEGIAKGVESDAEGEEVPLAEGFLEEFRGAFAKVDEAIADAKKYVRLCRLVLQRRDELREAIGKILIQAGGENGEDSLKVILERGRATNREIDTMSTAHGRTRDLWKSIKKQGELTNKIMKYRKWADAGDATKELGGAMRAEVIQMVEGLEGKMKEYFSQLYENEILELDMLTMGNAANPNVKDEINVYLRAGSERIPIGPFCNAGRLRALILSFVFALLKESKGSLGFIILDDPAVSLDDEHKERFVDHLVGPWVVDGQALLGTHYERFYKDSEPVFADGECMLMPPRRRPADTVSFEPGDLLERVETSLRGTGGNWREAAVNLRKWAERALGTLSGYCPDPFVVYNNVGQSIDNYASITDQKVATAERDTIVAALKSAKFQRVLHRPAHDESLNEAGVRDALKALEPCRAALKREIERFKKLRRHEVQGRGVTAEPVVQILSLPNTISGVTLDIVREAAAAHNGEGIEWDENERHTLEGHQVVILTTDVIDPIGVMGQYLLLDNEERMPGNSDLVVVQTANGERYVRRFWKGEDGSLLLEAGNPTSPWLPVRLCDGEHMMRRVVGVLYADLNVARGSQGSEWVPGSLPHKWLDGVMGVRVKGISMEPVAREGQIVLVRTGNGSEVKKAGLGCVDIAETGTVIKRCYPGEDEWVLCSVNPNEVEDPMRVKTQDIRYAYRLVGVLFEL